MNKEKSGLITVTFNKNCGICVSVCGSSRGQCVGHG